MLLVKNSVGSYDDRGLRDYVANLPPGRMFSVQGSPLRLMRTTYGYVNLETGEQRFLHDFPKGAMGTFGNVAEFPNAVVFDEAPR